MKLIDHLLYPALLIAGLTLMSVSSTAQTPAQREPETVLATFRVKPDQLPAFLKLMPQYWTTLRSLGLVLPEPHVVLQGEEHGRPVIVEVFTWKDHDAPEHVPAQVQQYWDKINAMVETRDRRPGIDFPEMTIVKQHQPISPRLILPPRRPLHR